MMITINTKKTAFTLIELLVVIAIMSLLLLVVVPCQGKARQSAQLDLCRNNLHQWAIAVETWAADHDGNAPLTTTYGVDNGRVTAAYPNEMYLDQYTGQSGISGLTGAELKAWQKKLISHEGIAPYLPGFNDKGLRYAERAQFRDFPDNWILEGVWKCPSQNKDRERDLEFILDTLTGQFGGDRAWFRVDYSYFGRSDLWDLSMFAFERDRSSLVEKFPASGRVMLADTIAGWGNVYWYNHGSEGPSYDNPTGEDQLAYTKSPDLITGMNEAYGDGSVQWKKIDSDDRFRLDVDGEFDGKNNRHMVTNYFGGVVYY